MENDYIRFFVEYYQQLGFNKIFIYDNNYIDGERFEEVIDDYIDCGLVEVIDLRGLQAVQLAAYQDCYDKHNKEYDWIAFFDIDEFMTFIEGTTDVHDFLSHERFTPYQVLHINWMVYGDNDLLDNDGRSVVERFKEPVMPLNFKTREHPWNDHVKSIVRGGLSGIKWNSPHTPTSKYHLCCNPRGEAVDIQSPFQDYDFTIVFLRHYRTKAIGEWVKNKMQRGLGTRSEKDWKSILTIDHFFEYNSCTKEKLDYAESLLKGFRANSH